MSSPLYSNEADATVASLPDSGTLVGTELFYADNGAADVKVTAAQIKAFANAGITLTPDGVGLGNVTNDTQTKAAVVPNTAPSAGQVLAGNAGGTAYAPVSLSGDATLASTGAVAISAIGGVVPGPFYSGTNAASLTGTINNARLSAIPNTALANSSVTISGHSLSLGGTLSLAKADVGLSAVTNDMQTKAAIVPNTAPTAGQLLVGNAAGTAYAPVAVSGDATLSPAGVVSVSKTGGVVFGNAATKNVGTTAGTVAAGDDARFGASAGVYDTRTAAAAASPTVQNFQVLNEGEQATYTYDPTTSSTATITTANGRKYRNVERVLTPKMFGADPASGDNQQALMDMAAEIRWRGGGQIAFPDNKTFACYTTAPAAGDYRLLDFSSCRGVHVRGNGCKITFPGNLATMGTTYKVVAGADVNGLVVEDIEWDQPDYRIASTSVGTAGALIYGNSKNVILRNIKGQGGIFGLDVDRAGSYSNNDRAREIWIDGADFSNVEYPMAFQSNGDHVVAEGIITKQCGRTYFPQNVSNHDVSVQISMATSVDACLLKVYASSTYSAYENSLQGIKLRVLMNGISDAGNQASIVHLQAQQTNDASPASAFFRDIDVRLTCLFGSSFQPGQLITNSRYTAAGSFDTTSTSHTWDNIMFSGTVDGLKGSNNGPLLFNNANGGWSHDFIRNVGFRNFTMRNSDASPGINVNGTPFASNLILEDVYCDGAGIVVQAPAIGVLQAYKGVGGTGLKSSNFIGANGPNYRRLPDGLLECWGYTTCTINSSTVVSFPVAFREGPSGLTTQRGDLGDTGDVNVNSVGTSSFTISRPNNGSASAITIYWRAIGRA